MYVEGEKKGYRIERWVIFTFKGWLGRRLYRGNGEGVVRDGREEYWVMDFERVFWEG